MAGRHGKTPNAEVILQMRVSRRENSKEWLCKWPVCPIDQDGCAPPGFRLSVTRPKPLIWHYSIIREHASRIQVRASTKYDHGILKKVLSFGAFTLSSSEILVDTLALGYVFGARGICPALAREGC